MRIRELIQPEVKNRKGFELTQVDNGITYIAHSSGHRDLSIIAHDGNRQIGNALFRIHYNGDALASDDTYVAKDYRKQGIANYMYNWAEQLGNTIVKSDTLSQNGRAFWQRRAAKAKPTVEELEQELLELDFMGHACTKDCSGHKAGYEWSLKRNGATAQTPSPSFNNGTTIAQAKRAARPQGGGKMPGYTSQTKDAIRKREARLQARQQQTTVGNVGTP